MGGSNPSGGSKKESNASKSTVENPYREEKNPSSSSVFWKVFKIVFRLAILIFLGAIVWSWARFYSYFQEQSVRDFVKWYKGNGGYMSPDIILSNKGTIHGTGVFVKHDGPNKDISLGRQLFRVPQNVQMTQITAQNALNEQVFTSSENEDAPKIPADPIQTITKHLLELRFSPLEQQDLMIALQLMLECSKGRQSFFFPYLNLLPKSVPRLDTFTKAELDFLGDDSFKELALRSKQSLEDLWKTDIIQTIIKLIMAQSKKRHVDASCLSWDSFHHFNAIAGSRTMILKGTKYLTPPLDFLNHDTRPPIRSDIEPLYGTFHNLASWGSIRVMADRNKTAGEELFEEYGKLDNSIYLYIFGFVPVDNPHHCVMLETPKVVGTFTPELEKKLKRIHPSIDLKRKQQTICVHADGTMLDEEDGKILFSLAWFWDILQDCLLETKKATELNSCFTAISLSPSKIKKHFQQQAQRVMKTFPNHQDTELLKELEKSKAKEYRGMRTDRVILALKFRIEDRKVMQKVANL